jgi:hypothetical protein
VSTHVVVESLRLKPILCSEFPNRQIAIQEPFEGLHLRLESLPKTRCQRRIDWRYRRTRLRKKELAKP